MRKQLQADLMLVFVTFCWGISYYMMDVSLLEVDPLTLNAYRFLGSFILLGIFLYPKLKTVNKRTLKYSFIIGLTVYIAYIGATYGVKYTSLTNAGFLCALAVIFTPLFNTILEKKMPDCKFRVVILLSLVGIGLLTLSNEFILSWGDLLCILCAFSYSFDMIIIERAVKKEKVDAFQIGVYQLLFAGILFTISAFIFETPTLPKTPLVWVSVGFLAIFCTGLALMIQAIAQQYTTANHVGVIFTLEPVFAGFVAYFIAGEVLLPRAYVGAALLIGSLLLMEVDIKKLGKKKQ